MERGRSPVVARPATAACSSVSEPAVTPPTKKGMVPDLLGSIPSTSASRPDLWLDTDLEDTLDDGQI
jgi:hypothetical protein